MNTICFSMQKGNKNFTWTDEDMDIEMRENGNLKVLGRTYDSELAKQIILLYCLNDKDGFLGDHPESPPSF